MSVAPAQPEQLNTSATNTSSCFDVSITGQIEPAQQIEFIPVSRYLRKKIGKSKFNFVGGKRAGVPNGELPFQGIGSLCPPGGPKRTIIAIGDGNCLFRSLSYLLIGNQEKHDIVRHFICEFIADANNLNKLRSFIDSKYSSGPDYISRVGMANNGVWGTEVEIFAFAMLTGKDVIVYSLDRWLRYCASGFNGKSSKQGWYLNNTSGDHFDPVLSV